uniref:Uncharacterized protein n=1 Tax=Timema douglasi TaxID=61478 RepID=A0A7R8VJR3_TIMDO|nr:unnamed protein product [Timema douglasi]
MKVELNTTSALANYATEAVRLLQPCSVLLVVSSVINARSTSSGVSLLPTSPLFISARRVEWWSRRRTSTLVASPVRSMVPRSVRGQRSSRQHPLLARTLLSARRTLVFTECLDRIVSQRKGD